MTVYPNLRGEMAKRGVIQSRLAEELKINISTLNSKLADPKRLKYHEAVKIHKAFFSNMDLIDLFATDEQTETAN